MSEIDVVIANTTDSASIEENNAYPQAKRSWKTKIPWTTLCVGMILIICCILEWGYDIPNGNIRRWNAFLSMLFNGGGLWIHFLPNLVLCLVFGSIIECIIGSVYMAVVVLLSYTTSVLYNLVMYEWIIQPIQNRGNGFSIMAYQWFTIGAASLFLHYWWRPLKMWSRESSSDNAEGRFCTWCRWMIGIFLLFGGGWIPHFAIKGLAALFYSGSVNDHAHVWAVIMGYGVSAVIAVLLGCEYRCSKQRTHLKEQK